MFRLTKAEERSRTLLTVEGQITGDSAPLIELCCDQAAQAGKPVRLCLRDILVIDPAGRALLGRLAAKGVRLFAKGVYTSYLLRQIGQAGGAGEARGS
jgi:hypothetical protein